MIPDQRDQTLGTLSALLAFTIWGALPLYWRWLDAVPAFELLTHRIFWALVLLAIIVPLFQRRELRSALRDPKALLAALLAGFLLGINWFIYIWSISVERLVESSLGYYINPLVSVLLGVIFLRERLSRAQLVALLLATAGVLVLTVSYGRFPWISLALAFTFGTYGLLKKVGRIGSVVGLFIEMWIIGPAAGIYLGILLVRGGGAFATVNPLTTALLAGAGIVTVAPLLLFGAAARRIPLSRVGFLQYIAPTSMLLIGTLLWGEPFTAAHAVSFGLIWTALAIYTVTLVRGRRRRRDPGRREP